MKVKAVFLFLLPIIDYVKAKNGTGNETISIRLSGGDIPTEGRVEVFHSGEWGTICDDDWRIESANVVCRMMGYVGAWEYVHSGKFGPGEGKIWMDNVDCNGRETDISKCNFNGWEDHDCSHHEDAGVRCNTARLPNFHLHSEHVANNLDIIRLKPARGQRRYHPQLEGYAEVYIKKKWRKICTTRWDEKIASVFCGQLGFPRAEPVKNLEQYLSRARKKHYYGLKNVTCTGTENKLSQCEFVITKSSKVCGAGEPLLTSCVPGYRYSRGRFKKKKGKSGRKNFKKSDIGIRLKAGAGEGEGRIEVKKGGRWGTICHVGFDIRAANVACRQLGFGTAKREIINSFFGNGHGPMWMSDFDCYGNETRLDACLHRETSDGYSGYHGDLGGCTHHEDAGVSCYVPQFHAQEKIRIVGGRNPMEGRVEVKIRKQWGPICSDHWTMREAMVVCKQLGLGFALHALKDAYYFPGSPNTTQLMMTGLNCDGDEIALHFCKHDGKELKKCGNPARTLTPFAGVICTEMAPDLLQDIPLLQQSLHIDDQPLHNLYCAAEENCLAPSAEDMDWPYGSRRLLRFSTRVWNRGRADFMPEQSRDQWIWHQCHGHYHSMAEFTHYDLLDLNFTKVAQGHKASFCLEDSECDSGVTPRFDCDQPGGGVQGIAVGCADNYQYNIDCQWIDITDVKAGNYLFRVRVNPQLLISESNFDNNEVYCNFQYDGHRMWAWNCHIKSDYDLETLKRYYSSSNYP